MSNRFPRFLSQIMPIVSLVIFLAFFVMGLVLFSYFLVFFALIGFALFGIAWIREKIFHHPSPPEPQNEERPGRIIEHDDDL